MRKNKKIVAVSALVASLLGFGAAGAKALVDVDAAVVAVADIEAVLDDLDLELDDIFDLAGEVEDGVDGLLEEIQDLEVADIVEAAVGTTVTLAADVHADVHADVELLVELIDDLDADGLAALVVDFAEEAGAEVLDRVDTVLDTVDGLDADALLDVDAAAAVIALVELF